MIRVGQGFDVHRHSDDPGRALVLGGCRFDGERGLDGHSDADVPAHAAADALLGASGIRRWPLNGGGVGLALCGLTDRSFAT